MGSPKDSGAWITNLGEELDQRIPKMQVQDEERMFASSANEWQRHLKSKQNIALLQLGHRGRIIALAGTRIAHDWRSSDGATASEIAAVAKLNVSSELASTRHTLNSAIHPLGKSVIQDWQPHLRKRLSPAHRPLLQTEREPPLSPLLGTRP